MAVSSAEVCRYLKIASAVSACLGPGPDLAGRRPGAQLKLGLTKTMIKINL